MQPIINATLNTIFVSIPEEFFIVFIALTLLGLDDLLDIRLWKRNLMWIMIPTIPVSILINVFRYVIIIPKQTMMISIMAIMIIFTEYIVIKNSDTINIKLIGQTAIFTIAGFVIVGVIEYSYYPVLLSLLHQPISLFYENVFLNILWAIPVRVIYVCIIAFVIMIKNSTAQINLLNYIIKNKCFSGSFLVILTTIVSVIAYITKLVNSGNILSHLNLIDQLIIIIAVTSIPIILITWALMSITLFIIKEKEHQNIYKNLIAPDDQYSTDDNDWYE